jgi:hypothetical protein
MAVNRITRESRLSPEEGTKYREIREQVAEELPDLMARHQERLMALEVRSAGLPTDRRV